MTLDKQAGLDKGQPAGSLYEEAYSEWARDPLSWWAHAAEAIEWDKPFDKVFDAGQGPHGRWFVGGRLNTSVNCLDRHIAQGRGEQPALIWHSAMTGTCDSYSYSRLFDRVAKFAGALSQLGVGRGDCVLIYMPMVPEAAIAMLACARLGAVHSVVFGGFAPAELATRMEDCEPKVVVAASCGLEPHRVVAYKPMLDEAIELSSVRPHHCVILQRPMAQADLIPGRDLDFEAIETKAPPHDPVSVAATDPLYIIHTSGTTGGPKGVMRDNGGHAVSLMRSMRMIYGLEAADTMFTASDVGWVVGHCYIVYGPLLAGGTSILYEGKPVGTPDAAEYWRVIERHRVKVLFTSPTAIRAIRREDPENALAAEYDLSSLRAIYLAGERCDPPTAIWLHGKLGKPVVDHWWQTETGWPITAGLSEYGLFPFKPGSSGWPAPGWKVAVLDDEGNPLPASENGNLVLKLPLPPGFAPTLWRNDEGFRRSYLSEFPGWYRTGDAGRIDEDGAVWVMGRTDDVINVAGHRLSTGAMEEILAGHPDVAECAVVGVADEMKGQVPFGLIVLKNGAEYDEAELAAELVARVRERIGPVAAFREVRTIKRLPKTRSGKIIRGSIREILDGETFTPPPTIEDPSVLDEIRSILWPRIQE
jgi:propionyl-CoA synthetase